MLKRLFQRKPPSELGSALAHINIANEIIMANKRNGDYMPSDKDLALLANITQAFYEGYAAAGYVHQCLTQRKNGEPEGARKFSIKEEQ